MKNIEIKAVTLLIAISAVGNAADLKPETLDGWNDYVRNVNSWLQDSPHERNPFLRADTSSGMSARLQNGEVIVAAAGEPNPSRVPGGLIHDWVVSAFVPDVRVEDVVNVLRCYGEYKQYYKPTVIESRDLGTAERGDDFSIIFKHRSIMSHTALETEYHVDYTQLDEKRWYSIAYTSRIQEIENYGQTGEHKLDIGDGSGYLWRVYTIAKFEEHDGGVYMEFEVIGLSRDIPGSMRWMIYPMIKRIAKDSLTSFMTSTREAVRLKTEIAARNRNSDTLATGGGVVAAPFRQR